MALDTQAPTTLVGVAAQPTEIPAGLWEYLVSVDADRAETERPRVFLQKAATALIRNDVMEPYDLIGFDVSDLARGSLHTCARYCLVEHVGDSLPLQVPCHQVG